MFHFAFFSLTVFRLSRRGETTSRMNRREKRRERRRRGEKIRRGEGEREERRYSYSYLQLRTKRMETIKKEMCTRGKQERAGEREIKR